MQNGKGSKPRPLSVPYDQYATNWGNIFQRKKQLTSDQKTTETSKKLEIKTVQV
jgi:hypothetical protein